MRAHKAAVVILIARITPGLSYLIPLFLAFQWLGLLDIAGLELEYLYGGFSREPFEDHSSECVFVARRPGV